MNSYQFPTTSTNTSDASQPSSGKLTLYYVKLGFASPRRQSPDKDFLIGLANSEVGKWESYCIKDSSGATIHVR